MASHPTQIAFRHLKVTAFLDIRLVERSSGWDLQCKNVSGCCAKHTHLHMTIARSEITLLKFVFEARDVFWGIVCDSVEDKPVDGHYLELKL
jgi:hypothetical protein